MELTYRYSSHRDVNRLECKYVRPAAAGVVRGCRVCGFFGVFRDVEGLSGGHAEVGLWIRFQTADLMHLMLAFLVLSVQFMSQFLVFFIVRYMCFSRYDLNLCYVFSVYLLYWGLR